MIDAVFGIGKNVRFVY